MKWFKMHSSVLHDATIQLLPADQFRTWINCLCMANENKDRGRLPDLKQVAFVLRMADDEVISRLDDLLVEGLLDQDDKGHLIHNWDRWQGQVDDSTERVKRHRAKMKARKAGAIRCPGAKAMPYADFLQTAYWQMRRKSKLAAADFKCSACGGEGLLDVHHNTYERLGEELDSDLIVLCRDCHELFHGNGKLAAPPL